MLVPALVMGIIPHVLILSPWINASCFISWVYLMLGAKKAWPLPPRWLTALLTFAAFAGIIIGSRGTFNSDSGIGLLCLVAALKPLEINNHRDRMITLFLAYFMVIAALFFSNSLEMTVYLYFSVVGITGCLVLVNHPDILPSKGFKLAFTITAQALPLSLVLFLVFPRIQGSLWGVQTSSTGYSGLSDTLSPGSLAGMRQSNELAMRVSFKDTIPGVDERYFRAIVFQNYDGKAWRVSWKIPEATTLPEGDDPVRYTVILEPHQQYYLVTMDYPGESPSGFTLNHDLTIRSRDRIVKSARYSLASYSVPSLSPLMDWEEIYIRLPNKGNSRSRILAESLRSQSGSVEELSNAILRYFRDQEFYYTLNPPVLDENPVDGFLFNTRKGYCEHYASAFVYLMRAAGVPARVVGGYYGGEINPYGGYLMVRQKDAHAWAEVYMEGKGWMRVDPTAAVDPRRVERDAAPAGSSADGMLDERNGFFKGITLKAQLAWDALNYQWYSRVIGYSTVSQRRFLEKLGLSLDSMAGILKTAFSSLALIAGLMMLYYLRLQMKTGAGTDPVKKGYVRFLKKLEAVGVICPSFSGPLDFADKAVADRKDLEKEIRGITSLYVLLRYGGKSEDENLIHDFLVLVGHFRPGKRKRVEMDNKFVDVSNPR
jgi:transglutaminase-like putative cysteine protease